MEPRILKYALIRLDRNSLSKLTFCLCSSFNFASFFLIALKNFLYFGLALNSSSRRPWLRKSNFHKMFSPCLSQNCLSKKTNAEMKIFAFTIFGPEVLMKYFFMLCSLSFLNAEVEAVLNVLTTEFFCDKMIGVGLYLQCFVTILTPSNFLM